MTFFNTPGGRYQLWCGFFENHGLGASPHTEKPCIVLPECLYSLDICRYVYCGCLFVNQVVTS